LMAFQFIKLFSEYLADYHELQAGIFATHVV
jgi:hypothetical protein